MYTSSENKLKIDRDQIAQLLQLLGYAPGKTVCVRAFFHSNDLRSKTDKGRKAEATTLEQIVQIVEKFQNEGRGVYFVVNSGGHTNAEIKDCYAMFYEHDNVPKEEQLDLWRPLGLPEPTLQVDTGGKSIHSYWVFDKPINPTQWKTLQTDLLEFANADRSLKNPSRVMRLPGGYHISDKGIHPTTIVSASGIRYSFEHLRAIIPTPAKPEIITQIPQIPQAQQVEEPGTTWTEPKYAASYLKALAPWRCEVYQEWIEVGMALHSVGDDALLQDWINWSRGASNFCEGECEKKWQTFKSSGIKIGTLGGKAKADGWVSSFPKNSYQPNAESSKTCNERQESQPISKAEQLKLELQALLKEEDPIVKIFKRNELCGRFSISGKDLDYLISTLETSNRTQKAKCYTAKQFQELEPAGLQWLVPGLLPAKGLTVLGGAPGIGKSTLAYDMAACILFGEPFLGETPRTGTGKVLFVASDELPAFVMDKLMNRSLFDSESWEVMIDWDVSQMNALEDKIREMHPALVVIDSFTSIHKDVSFDENSAQSRQTIVTLEAMLNRYEASGLLIHHTSKSKDQTGVGKLRGSSAIAAAASAVWLLEGEDKSPLRIFSTPKIRGAQPLNLRLTLDAPNGRWEVTSGNEEDDTYKTLGERILAFLATEPDKRFCSEEIINAVGNKDIIYKTLDRLIQRGLVFKRPGKINTRRKVYGLVEGHTTPPSPTPSVAMSTRISETTTIYESEGSGHRVDIEWTSSGQSNQEMSTVHSKTPADYEMWDAVDCPLDLGGGGESTNNVHSNTELDESPLPGESLTLNKPTSGTHSKMKNVESGAGVVQKLKIQIAKLWDKQWELGNLILQVADTDQLREATKDYTPDKIKHIKLAAKFCWKPGTEKPHSKADWDGELKYVWSVDGKNMKIGTEEKGETNVKRNDLAPWLGIG